MFLTLAAPAIACGGFFCSASPVDQSGEDVLFAVDERAGETALHVRISYTGESESFAWILPVSGVPEISLSTEALFATLDRIRPRYETDSTASGCVYDNAYADAIPPQPPSDVSLLGEEIVGPYQAVVLQASSSAALLTWLRDNGYDLPGDLDAVLAPYVAEQSHFVALKLTPGATVGMLQPVALRYPGTGMSIPIQLTAIAAADDMPLRVWVLGEHRAVPESYLHVVLDDLVVDWWSSVHRSLWRGSTPYAEVVARAVDEAGGRAFVTDHAGPASQMDGQLWTAERFDVEALAASPTPYDFMNALLAMGLTGDRLLLALFVEFLPMPEALTAQGVAPSAFYNCLLCYAEYVDAIPFDAPAFAAAVDERIITPRREAQALFGEHPWLTRLSSALSSEEMTVDPTFVFNPDLPQEVAPGRATLEHRCSSEVRDWDGAPLRFALPDGRSYELPSEASMREQRVEPYEVLAPLMDRYALVVEQTSASGPPVVLADHRAEAEAEAAAWNALYTVTETLGEVLDDPGAEPAGESPPVQACGCAGSGASPGGLAGPLAILAILGARRRAPRR